MRRALLAAVAISFAAVLPAHAAGFLGDTVDGAYDYPDTSTVLADAGTQLVDPAAVFDFTSYGLPVTATLDSNQITLAITGDTVFSSATFNGVIVTDLSQFGITGVSLDPSSNLPGFTASDLNYTSNSIGLNLQGLSVASGDTVVADVSFTPEPSAWALMMAGVAGVGLALRAGRRRAGGLTA